MLINLHLLPGLLKLPPLLLPPILLDLYFYPLYPLYLLLQRPDIPTYLPLLLPTIQLTLHQHYLPPPIASPFLLPLHFPMLLTPKFDKFHKIMKMGFF